MIATLILLIKVSNTQAQVKMALFDCILGDNTITQEYYNIIDRNSIVRRKDGVYKIEAGYNVEHTDLVLSTLDDYTYIDDILIVGVESESLFSDFETNADYAYQLGARLFIVTYDFEEDECSNKFHDTIIKVCNKYQDCIIVKAAGNQSQNLEKRNSADNLILVGAMSFDTSIKNYSSTGHGVDVYTEDFAIKGVKKNFGTSFAAPRIAACKRLLENDTVNVSDVKDIIAKDTYVKVLPKYYIRDSYNNVITQYSTLPIELLYNIASRMSDDNNKYYVTYNNSKLFY